jgi:hypothetical protein
MIDGQAVADAQRRAVMASREEPTWQPISALALVGSIIDGMLEGEGCGRRRSASEAARGIPAGSSTVG